MGSRERHPGRCSSFVQTLEASFLVLASNHSNLMEDSFYEDRLTRWSLTESEEDDYDDSRLWYEESGSIESLSGESLRFDNIQRWLRTWGAMDIFAPSKCGL